MVLEPILFAIEKISVKPTDEAKGLLILLDLLLTFSQSHKLVDNNGSDQLINDHLDDQQIDKIEKDMSESLARRIGT